MGKKASVRIARKGPIVVSNLDNILKSTGKSVSLSDKSVALCRCGASENKPFCDGMHAKIDFDDSEESTVRERELDDYEGRGIIIHDDRTICSNAGYCERGLPDVFDKKKDPWINPYGASVEEIIKTIKKCPSGALSYSIDGVKYDNYSDKESIYIIEDGPYKVQGNIVLDDKYVPQTQNHYELCRCGASENKPFCDESHVKEKFKDDGMIRGRPGQMCKCEQEDLLNEKIDKVDRLSRTGSSEDSSMSTLRKFPDWEDILFKGTQMSPLPYNKDQEVNMKTVIGKKAKKPLELSIPFYVSHMSFGALSKEAKIALAKGSSLVDTAMCSGEGGMLEESRENAKKYIYELGTAEFSHDDEAIKKADAVEIKLGQAVKIGVGGHLPAHKVTEEIAKTRGIDQDRDSISPARFHGVNSTEDLLEKVNHIREISGGVPVGIKIGATDLDDLKEVVKAGPDFITIDCRGGATGSTEKYLKDNIGVPAIFAIRRTRRYLDSIDSDISLCVTGGFREASDIGKAIALGADAIALATASLISIGCMQARVCHTGRCPSGITTQDEDYRTIFDEEKALKQFQNYYKATRKELSDFVRSNGKKEVHELSLDDVMTTSNEVSQNTDIDHV